MSEERSIVRGILNPPDSLPYRIEWFDNIARSKDHEKLIPADYSLYEVGQESLKWTVTYRKRLDDGTYDKQTERAYIVTDNGVRDADH